MASWYNWWSWNGWKLDRVSTLSVGSGNEIMPTSSPASWYLKWQRKMIRGPTEVDIGPNYHTELNPADKLVKSRSLRICQIFIYMKCGWCKKWRQPPQLKLSTRIHKWPAPSWLGGSIGWSTAPISQTDRVPFSRELFSNSSFQMLKLNFFLTAMVLVIFQLKIRSPDHW